jgi:hypothetical protein
LWKNLSKHGRCGGGPQFFGCFRDAKGPEAAPNGCFAAVMFAKAV